MDLRTDDLETCSKPKSYLVCQNLSSGLYKQLRSYTAGSLAAKKTKIWVSSYFLIHYECIPFCNAFSSITLYLSGYFSEYWYVLYLCVPVLSPFIVCLYNQNDHTRSFLVMFVAFLCACHSLWLSVWEQYIIPKTKYLRNHTPNWKPRSQKITF